MSEKVEVSAAATPELKFVGGVLHQVFIVSYDDGSSEPVLRAVPSDDEPAAE